jgi:hypothetical protein
MMKPTIRPVCAIGRQHDLDLDQIRPLRVEIRLYFSEVLIEVNLVLSLPPKPFTTAIIASAIPAAIRPPYGRSEGGPVRAQVPHPRLDEVVI